MIFKLKEKLEVVSDYNHKEVCHYELCEWCGSLALGLVNHCYRDILDTVAICYHLETDLDGTLGTASCCH